MSANSLVRGLVATTILVSPAFAARAQDTDKAAKSSVVDEVVVTGTRLQNPNFVAPTPVTSVSSQQIEQRAPAAIMDVLQELPTFRASSGPTQVQRLLIGPNAGQSTASLRGLGASRTLSLVNGRRIVGQNTGGTLDTAVIPAGLLQRVEVVTGGASAAYGSDAVAGVVNYILKDQIDGISGSLQVGSSQEGDNKEYGFTLEGGFRFSADRGRVVLGVDYNRNDGVGTIYSRERTSIEPGNTASPIPFGAARAAGVPAQGFLPNVEFSSMTFGSIITTARTATGAASTALNLLAFNPDGSTYTLFRGQVYGALMAGVTSNYGATGLSNWGLKTPNNRAAVMGAVNYEFTDQLRGFVETNFARTEIDGFSSFHTQPRITILRTNPFLPTAIRDRMTQLNLTEIDIGRVDTEWGGAQTRSVYKTYRVAAGLEGDLPAGWKWDAYAQYGRTLTDGELYHTRESNLYAAEYVVTGPDGRPACGPLASNPNFAASRLSALVDPKFVQPGCVPFNPFGQGNNTQSAIDYVSGDQLTKVEIRQQVVAVNLAGNLITLPAGPISIATGLEYREDYLSQSADALQELGIYANGNNKSYSGKNQVGEGYVEVGVPLLRDLPFLKTLDLNAAARRTHYETSGWVTTWKVGLNYEINDQIRLRATQSRDIRAPALDELFSFGGTVAGANLIANPFNSQLGRLPITARGNPDLKPEIADTFTAGVVLQPTFLPGLRASIDYYRIEVAEVIAAVGVGAILDRCFEGNQVYCAAIEFDNSVYGIRNVNTSPFNQAALRTRGVDLEVAYRVPEDLIPMPGQWDIRFLANWSDQLERIDRVGPTGVAVNSAGTAGGMPKYSGTVSFNYTLADFSAGLQYRAFTAIRYSPTLLGPSDGGYNPALTNSVNVNRFPGMGYASLNVAQRFDAWSHPFQAFAVVNNLFNTQPPHLSIAALNTAGNPYDYVGRTFKAGIRFTW